MQKDKKKISVIIFAFGFMGKNTLKSFYNNSSFKVEGIIIPKKNKYYSSNIEVKKIEKGTKVLASDSRSKVYNFIKKIKPKIVVISTFNKIIDSKTLSLSNFINIHHGKLPKQKGRASINWALVMGRNSIFITIHQAIPKLDSGKIIYQKKIKIFNSDNYETIQKKITSFLSNNISKIIKKYLQKKIILKKNNSNQETWNCSRNPEDSMLNFFEKREKILNLIKASYGKKFGAFCFLKEKKIIILEANIKSKKKFEGIIPGRIVALNKDGSVDCLCINGILTIDKILYKNKVMKPKNLIKSTRATLLND